MIPKEIIEKAIEGGWQDGQALDPSRVDVLGVGYIRIYHWDSSEFNGYEWQELALDPTFWQALGNSLDIAFEEKCAARGDFVSFEKWNWKLNAHRFYDLILTKQPIEAFWSDLFS